jgi:hypothetical protein
MCYYKKQMIGKFKGSYPKQAARKAISRISKENNTESLVRCSVKKIGDSKNYVYVGKRIRRDHPRVVLFTRRNKLNNKNDKKYVAFKYVVHVERV